MPDFKCKHCGEMHTTRMRCFNLKPGRFGLKDTHAWAEVTVTDVTPSACKVTFSNGREKLWSRHFFYAHVRERLGDLEENLLATGPDDGGL